ncbi:MAG: hypothetical protein IJU45_07550, partial [Clostridia bacterium]|nr:hypothetical protein [Clostridia bacterium]
VWLIITFCKAEPYTVGGYTLCPRKGVMRMQYVTYSDLIQFVLMIVGIVGLAIAAVHTHKKK